jgi:hypothetical protein
MKQKFNLLISGEGSIDSSANFSQINYTPIPFTFGLQKIFFHNLAFIVKKEIKNTYEYKLIT